MAWVWKAEDPGDGGGLPPGPQLPEPWSPPYGTPLVPPGTTFPQPPTFGGAGPTMGGPTAGGGGGGYGAGAVTPPTGDMRINPLPPRYGGTTPPPTTNPWINPQAGPWWGGGVVLPWGAGQPAFNWENIYGGLEPAEAQAWYNVMLPWFQQAQQQQQFEQQMEYMRWLNPADWQAQMDRLQAELQSREFLTTGGWEQEAARQAERLQAERENLQSTLATRETEAAYAAFGRRWRPNTRWM